MPQHMFADTPATHSRPHDGSTPPNAPATTVEVRRDEVGATRFSLQRGRDERCCPLLKSPKSDLSLEPGRMSDRRICYRADLFTALAAGKSTRWGTQSALGHAPDRAKLVVAEHRPCGSPYSAIVWSIELGRVIRITLESAVLCG